MLLFRQINKIYILII